MKHYVFLPLFLFATAIGLKGQNSGNALNFDGVDDHVVSTVPNVLSNTASFSHTVEAWILPQSATFQRVLFAQTSTTNLVSLSLTASNNVYYYVVENGITISGQTTISYTPGVWLHVAATWNTAANTIQIYQNGILQATTLGGTTSTGTNGIMTLGSRSDASQFYTGTMDEVRVWNGVRSACEIGQLMNSTLVGDETNLMAYYNFNNGTAGGSNAASTNLADHTGNGHSGSLTGFALTGSTSNWVASGAIINNVGNIEYNSINASCGLHNGSITITSAPGLLPLQYSINGGSFQTSNSFTDLAGGTYTVLISDANSCGSSVQVTLTTSDTVDASVTRVNATTLTANLTGATYQWLDCNNGFAPIATNGTFLQYTATANGNFAVAVTKNGCTDTSACFSIVIDGIDDITFAANTKLYPNPTNGLLHIDMSTVQNMLTVKLVNTLGQVMATQQFIHTNAISMPVDVPSGLYMVQVENGEGQSAVFRLVKE